jgi:hypothetical protein
MRDWYVGQKIVCVNAQPIGGVINRFVEAYLREGKIYRIRKILGFNYRFGNKIEEKIAFRLEGIVPYLIEGTEYAFFHGRFKPLENHDLDQDVDISIFFEALRKVNEGLITIHGEEIRELEYAT